jgi:hypothetical protein
MGLASKLADAQRGEADIFASTGVTSKRHRTHAPLPRLQQNRVAPGSYTEPPRRLTYHTIDVSYPQFSGASGRKALLPLRCEQRAATSEMSEMGEKHDHA